MTLINPWAVRQLSPTRYSAGLTLAGGPLVHRFEAGHRLVAGVTRSGKTYTINAMLCCFAGRPDCAIVGLDPKMTGLTPWHGRATEVAQTLTEIDNAINRCIEVMNLRMVHLANQGRAHWTPVDGPRLVLVCDEFADLAGLNTSAIDRSAPARDVIEQFKAEKSNAQIRTANMATLARMGAGLGIDVVIGTQYPETQVLPAQIRSQLDVRLVHRVTSKEQLAVCLGQGRADELNFKDIRPGTPGLMFVTGSEDHEMTELARSAFVDVPEVARYAARTAFMAWSWDDLQLLRSVESKARHDLTSGSMSSAQASYVLDAA